MLRARRPASEVINDIDAVLGWTTQAVLTGTASSLDDLEGGSWEVLDGAAVPAAAAAEKTKEAGARKPFTKRRLAGVSARPGWWTRRVAIPFASH